MSELPHDELVYNAHYIESSLDIDGRLDEDEWVDVDSSSIFADVESCIQGRLLTSYRAVFDSTYLYLGIKARDPDVRASVRDDNKHLYKYDPTIEIFLDPNADGRDYHEIQVNAHNAVWQLSFDKPLKRGGRSTDPDMLAGLRTAVNISGSLNDDRDTDEYWTVEMAIPWSSFGDRDVLLSQMWKMNIGRVYHDDQNGPEFWAWSCSGALDMHLPMTWGELRFKK